MDVGSVVLRVLLSLVWDCRTVIFQLSGSYYGGPNGLYWMLFGISSRLVGKVAAGAPVLKKVPIAWEPVREIDLSHPPGEVFLKLTEETALALTRPALKGKFQRTLYTAGVKLAGDNSLPKAVRDPYSSRPYLGRKSCEVDT